MALDIIIVFTIFAWAMIAIALWRGDKWIGFMAGAMILVFGVMAMINGVQDTNNTLTRMYAFVSIGVGLYVTLVSAWEMGEEVVED